MKPNFYLPFKHPRYISGSSCCAQRRIHTGSPVLPCGICIDRDKPLANTTPPYTQHVVISTGHDDWASRIENEEGPNLAKGLKELLGRNGELHHPDHKILVTNSSFPSSYGSGGKKEDFTSTYLFPSFQYIPRIANTLEGHRVFARALLSPIRHSTSAAHDSLPPIFIESSPLTAPVVLICGHGTRDQRCGIYGPILRDHFELHLPSTTSPASSTRVNTSQVALISHIGGHAFAGNVILYIPPGYTPPHTKDSLDGEGQLNPLAGSGIWYGRVEPDRVREIVRETIVGGRILEPLFRGGISSNGLPFQRADQPPKNGSGGV
ncbi:hypothetical protein MMC07_001936 [Pseudocyphellaria aurata]|nr:hypothetical protein [Pseudocyphellaria aurata]